MEAIPKHRFFKILKTGVIVFIFVLFSCGTQNPLKNRYMHKQSRMYSKTEAVAPVAARQLHESAIHNQIVQDYYHWMRLTDEQKEAETPDTQTQQVVSYLNAENAYREKMTAHTQKFQEKLFEEIKDRIKQTDMSVPYKDNGYHYITRYEEGNEYPIYSRKKGDLAAPEEILLNVNELAKDHAYYAIGSREVSLDNNILAYSEDVISRRQYTIRFKNLTTQTMYEDKIPNTNGSVVWGNDNQTIFYTTKDEALRDYSIFRHTLGTPVEQDVLVYQEKDPMFYTFIYKTKSKKYLVIGSESTLSTEYRILEADTPTGVFRVFQDRLPKHEYDIDHYGNNWYIRTNTDDAINFKIMKTPENATQIDNWLDFLPYNPDIFIDGIHLFRDNMVVSERRDGITQLHIRPWNGIGAHYIQFEEDDYTVSVSVNPDFDTALLRIDYTSLTTPSTTYDYNIQERKLYKLKQQEVLGHFDQDDYISERQMVEAPDGTLIPLSIVYKKGFKKDGSRSVLLYGYGSYGISIDSYFSSARLSLLDRGFAFAIAHIRGGGEMGRQWYEDGKFLKKKNTFTDFIACGEFLIQNKYASHDLLFAQGGSAGGLLMGAVMNMRPELWKGILAAVPFVDVVNTMLDESIPLTTGEFDEWGNPKDKKYYDYMRSYSPYDNVEAKAYPPTLITTGYWDSQVQYWEPAKWIAKLREFKTDNNPLLMYCNMDTGHGGASGRFERWKEVAMGYVFLLDLAGITE